MAALVSRNDDGGSWHPLSRYSLPPAPRSDRKSPIRGKLRTHGIDDALVGHLDARIGVGRAFLVFTREAHEIEHCHAAASALLERASEAPRFAGKLTWRATDAG